MKTYLTLLVSTAMAGCSTVTVTQGLNTVVDKGYTQVAPTTVPRVGHLYTTVGGLEPSFATKDGRIFRSLCTEDFEKTKALADIAKTDVSDVGSPFTKKTLSDDGSLSLAGKIPALGGLAFGPSYSHNRTYTIENLRTLALTASGIQLVRDKIGEDCRAKVREKGANVVLLVAAQRADKATDSITDNGGVSGSLTGKVEIKGKSSSASVELGSGDKPGASWKHSDSTEYALVYLSVKPSSFGP